MTHGNRIKQRILVAGLAIKWPDVSARAIGRELHLTHSAVLYHFGTSEALASAIAKFAVDTEASKVIVQLLATNHPAIEAMETELRYKYAKLSVERHNSIE